MWCQSLIQVIPHRVRAAWLTTCIRQYYEPGLFPTRMYVDPDPNSNKNPKYFLEYLDFKIMSTSGVPPKTWQPSNVTVETT